MRERCEECGEPWVVDQGRCPRCGNRTKVSEADRSDTLLVVDPVGMYVEVANDYHAIKTAMGVETIDMVPLVSRDHAFFVDDEGMLNGSGLNFPASMMAGRVLYGTVCLIGPAGPEGETLTPENRIKRALMGACQAWRQVCADAVVKGQRIIPTAEPDRIPPPQIIGLTDEQFEHWLSTGETP